MGAFLRGRPGPLYIKTYWLGSVQAESRSGLTSTGATGSTTPVGVGARWEGPTDNDAGSGAGVGAGVGRVISDPVEGLFSCRDV